MERCFVSISSRRHCQFTLALGWSNRYLYPLRLFIPQLQPGLLLGTFIDHTVSVEPHVEADAELELLRVTLDISAGVKAAGNWHSQRKTCSSSRPAEDRHARRLLVLQDHFVDR